MNFVRASFNVLGFHVSMSDEAADKAKLRSKMKSYLSTVSREHIQSSSTAIVHYIAEAQELINKASTIAIYSAIQNEISVSELHQLLPEKKILYPLCQPGYQLSFHHVTSEDQLITGSMHIPEPQPNLHTELKIRDIDIILCPGLAFGSDGSRLGRGQGYYDRALNSFSGLKLGITLDHQIKKTVPHNLHDAPMDYLVSESGISATTPWRG